MASSPPRHTPQRYQCSFHRAVAANFTMADGGVKMEVKPEIKVDAGDSPSGMDHIEQFVEDPGDVEFPPEGSQAWLVNVPKAMWVQWNEAYKNAQVGETITLGKMRVYHQQPGQTEEKIEIIPSEESRRENSELADKYSLELKANGYNNTVVFSEKDLPGHRNQPFGRYNSAARPSGIQAKNDRYGQQQQPPQQQKKPGGYRTAIPKRTALAPPIQHEGLVTPVMDDPFADLAKAFQAEADKTAKVGYSNTIRQLQPGASNKAMFQIGSLSSKIGAKGAKKKPPKEKAVRMEKSQLLDALQTLFREYSYWRLSGLKARLNQPEQFIKETLEDIAVLVKSGDFSNTYKLKPEYENLARMQAEASGGVKQELAPELVGATDSEMASDEMDEDDFEDVDVDMKHED